MKTIYGNYKIDESGNIYSKRGLLNPRIDNGSVRVNLNQKWVSHARVIATYLCDNPNNFDRLIFRDKNPLNCSPKNLKWVSEQKFQQYIYKAQIRKRISDKEAAIEKCKCPILKQYYKTGNVEIVNDYFITVSRQIRVDYWRDIQGYVYIKVMEKLQRFTILYDLKTYIVSRLEFYRLANVPKHYH